jgi:hypothetical protein
MRNILSGRLAILGATCALVACSKGTEPPTPTTIAVTPGGTVTLVSINQTQQLSAVVLDQHGATMPGLKVAWVTNNALIATVDTLGIVKAKANGSATVTASNGGASTPVSVTVAQTGAAMTKTGGDGQIGSHDSTLSALLSVNVKDANGNPAAGVSVTFSAAAGNGVGVPATVLTGAGGTASTHWKLGTNTPRQTITATAGTGTATFAAGAVGGGTAAGFQITLVNVGPTFSAPVQAAFDSAVAKWQRVITGDLADISGFTVAASGICPAVSGGVTVDDVLIVARVDSIDGPGQILGSAGPCWIRNTGFLTIMGGMVFDSADMAGLVASGSLNSVILHEMGHVLGFGTLWGSSFFNCLQNASSTGNLIDTNYNCARGLVVFDSIGGTSYTGGNKVPVENCVGIPGCGAGTFNSHWRESTFFNELMTGYLNNGVANPLSVLTAAQMQDLGYTVNLSAADAYTRTFTAPPAGAAALQLQAQRIYLGDDVYHGPVGVWDRGRVVRMIRPF